MRYFVKITLWAAGHQNFQHFNDLIPDVQLNALNLFMHTKHQSNNNFNLLWYGLGIGRFLHKVCILFVYSVLCG